MILFPKESAVPKIHHLAKDLRAKPTWRTFFAPPSSSFLLSPSRETLLHVETDLSHLDPIFNHFFTIPLTTRQKL